MEKELKEKLHYLRLYWLQEHWDEYKARITAGKQSSFKLLLWLIEQEVSCRKDIARLNRLKNAQIPELYSLDTYPFSRQPSLKKDAIVSLHDSLLYITEYRNLMFIGPTGCGKTGLAVSFLVQAINTGSRGHFTEFSGLLHGINKAIGSHNELKFIAKLSRPDILLIDEVGYSACNETQSSVLFDILKARHLKKTTIITSQLGADEWESIFPDRHIIAALLDRFTENCSLFDMRKCVSLRNKHIQHLSKL